jgi:hypothetical protein
VSELERQAALQAEARSLIARHRLDETLRRLGRVVPIGSFVTGLMVWRDLDYCVELERDDVWAVLLPLLERCDAAEYVRLPERHSFVLRLDGWKVDLSLWRGGMPDDVVPYPMGLDDETRLLLLRLKARWIERHPDEEPIWSFELYEAVLQDGARTIDEVERALTSRAASPS